MKIRNLILQLLIISIGGIAIYSFIEETRRRRLAPRVTEYKIPKEYFNDNNAGVLVITSHSDIDVSYTKCKNIPTFDTHVNKKK